MTEKQALAFLIVERIDVPWEPYFIDTNCEITLDKEMAYKRALELRDATNNQFFVYAVPFLEELQ